MIGFDDDVGFDDDDIGFDGEDNRSIPGSGHAIRHDWRRHMEEQEISLICSVIAESNDD